MGFIIGVFAFIGFIITTLIAIVIISSLIGDWLVEYHNRHCMVKLPDKFCPHCGENLKLKPKDIYNEIYGEY